MIVTYTKRFEIKAGNCYEFMLLNCGDTSTVEVLEIDGDMIRYRALRKEHTVKLVDFLLDFADEIPGEATVFTGE
jgi:hypothetical protein